MTELTYALCVVTANLLAILAFLVFPLDPSVLAVRRARVVPVSRALLGFLGSRLVPPVLVRLDCRAVYVT